MSPDKPSPAAAKQRIMGDLKQVSSEKWVRVEVCGSTVSQPTVHTADNIAQADETNLFRWQLALMVVNPESAFDGGYLKVGRTSTQ